MKRDRNRRGCRAGLGVRMALLGLVCTATTAAAQYTHHVYLDTDNNSATGCTVSAHEAGWTGTIAGIERDVQISVTTAAPATVTGVAVASCSGASFGSPQTVSSGTWPVGLNVGTGGADVIEGLLPRTFVPANATVRLYFHSSAGAPNDVLLTTSGSGGSPMTITLDAGGADGATAVPGLGLVGIVALGFGIALAAFGLLRSRAGLVGALLVGALAGAGVAYAATITMNGQVGDWSGISALGTDPTGDSSIGDPAEDIVAGFGAFDATNVYFRVDVRNVECTAATSPDATITAPAQVCANATGQTASVPSAGAGATYAWTAVNATIVSGQGSNSITFDTGSSGPVTLNVTVTSGSGCSKSGSVTMPVNPLPTITGLSASPGTIALGDTATITFTVANATNWSFSSSLGNSFSPVSGTSNGAITVMYSAALFDGTDTITLTATNGCGSTQRTTSIVVTP